VPFLDANALCSCRRLDNGWNIFEGMFKNYWFLGIQFIIIGFQIVIVFVGGAAFSVHKLNGPQWGISIVLGILSIPVAVIIRLFPDELFEKLTPHLPNRKGPGPTLLVEDDQEIQRWNPGLEEIRDELAFLKKIRGGRMSELTYKLQHPREVFMPRSRSGSRSRERSNSDLPQTPDGNHSGTELVSASPKTPEKSHTRRRTRSGSNSVFGATAMAGIIAGSIAGGLGSPIEGRKQDDSEPIRFSRDRAHSGLDGTRGIEIHPDTREDDPVIVEDPAKSPVPPSQNPQLAPYFEHGPGHQSSPSNRSRRSHSRQSSMNPPTTPKL
jgi:P-type Ca2+ transporter type 2C